MTSPVYCAECGATRRPFSEKWSTPEKPVCIRCTGEDAVTAPMPLSARRSFRGAYDSGVAEAVSQPGQGGIAVEEWLERRRQAQAAGR